MPTAKFLKGSEWQKWDLHVHTASSYDYAYKGGDADKLLVEEWKKHELVAVAITDHFVIDEARIKALKALAPDITIFPGVELRTDKGGINIHPILIFSEKTDLSILAEAFRTFKRDLATSADRDETISWDYNEIVKFAKKHEAIISIHTGSKANGLDKMITNALEVGQAVKTEYAESVGIFEVSNLKDVNDYKTIVFGSISERPVIICSDNHDPREYNIKESLWIKANPTFEGLKQVLIHSSERVYMGSIPPKLDKLAKKPSSYIKKVSVHKASATNSNSEAWFDFELPLNPGLVAIIGNKGSGKSALSDIIGLLCRCKTMKDCSFLNEKRFRKLPEVLAKGYSGEIIWCDDDSKKSNLGSSSVTSLEDAQYLPQQFIEKTCNNLDNSFQEEIDSVIFSYIEPEEKHGAESLKQLKETISKSTYIEIDEIKKAVKNTITELMNDEYLLDPIYKKNLSDKLEKKKEELEKHKKLEPKEVEKTQNAQNNQYQKELESIDKKISDFESAISRCQEQLKGINSKITKIETIKQKLVSLNDNLKALNAELQDFANENELDAKTMSISYTLPLKSLTEKLEEYVNDKSELTIKLHGDIDNTDGTKSLLEQLKGVKEEKNDLMLQADATEKAFQKYLEDKKEWEKDLKSLAGDKDTDNSVAYFEEKLRYINEDLEHDYTAKKDSLFTSVESLFEQKNKISEKLFKLYSPVECELKSVLGHIEEKIGFDIEISLKQDSKDFPEKILHHIYKNKSGDFYGETQAATTVKALLEKTNLGSSQGVIQFLKDLYEKLAEDFSVVKDKKVFYEFLFSLDYLDTNFALKLGKRPLQSLSAGEKGIVLLVFYLALNKNEKPIIIDQPEDNLDNQSVYSKLVACISKAKLKRQVIIVTHNPNIAIACDAEQIIHCSMDKDTCCIHYVSGALENNEIKQHVINVLEGTLPAFDLRRRKYA